MAGDLLLTNLDEHELDVLLTSGGTLGDTIFHADKYAQANWDIWGERLAAGLAGSRNNNRVNLPPHFYISFSARDLRIPAARQMHFAKAIGAAVRPLTIVSGQQALADWSVKKSNYVLLDIFTAALNSAAVTLEIYSYEGADLIDRGSGELHGSLSYMKRANE
jgi:hypothetical protein